MENSELKSLSSGMHYHNRNCIQGDKLQEKAQDKQGANSAAPWDSLLLLIHDMVEVNRVNFLV